uniref:G-protein coupled receptors family 1 profile domain-containing protein n=1 Tax=Oreochromis aureus TaxID=47969 RepID=A0AAZ1XU07_OREAU
MSCLFLHLFIVILNINFYFLQVRRSPVPVIYYTNLLTSNLIQICIMIVWILRISSSIPAVIHLSCVMASLYFRMCIALERYCFIACPLLDCLRQTEGSVLVCVLVWVLCIVSVALAVFLYEFVRLIIYAALPAPLFILCLAGTLKALPAATSVPAEEKRRIVGTLVLLLLNYFLINLPAVILLTLNLYPHFPETLIDFIIMIFFLFSSLLDLILFAFMCKGPIDRLLARLMESNNTGDVTDVSTDRSHHVVRDEGKRKQGHMMGEMVRN